MDSRLSKSDLRVYAAMVQLSHGDCRCSATVKEIQESSGVKRISRHTGKLVQSGHLEIKRHESENRNIYLLNIGNSLAGICQIITLKSFYEEYMKYAQGELSIKTQKTYKTAFREFIRVLGDKSLQSIGMRDIETFLALKKEEASGWTARKYFISLSSAFEKALQWELIKENPFRKVKKPKPADVAPTFFSDNEFRLFLSVVDDCNFRDLALTAILTGMRMGELIALRWSDIDFESRVILVQNSDTFTTKSKKNRSLDMGDDLIEVLQTRKENVRIKCETVFYDDQGRPLKEGTVSQKFKRYVRKARLNDKLHFHSLRHTFASALIKEGVPIYSVSRLLGHSSVRTTEIYAHLQPHQLQQEVNMLSGRFV